MHRWGQWDRMLESLREELVLLRERGFDPARHEADLQTLLETKKNDIAALGTLFDAVQANPGPRSPDDTHCEPSSLPAIRRERPEGPRRMDVVIDDEQLRDRIHGAWLGRIAGCMLGKPVECRPYEQIKRVGEHIGQWPLRDYFPYLERLPDGLSWHTDDHGCFRENLRYGVRDDDLDYTILGLKILETFGPGFTSDDVAVMWLHSLPLCYIFTAEHVAYINLVNHIDPPRSAFVRNGFREWIGAQIRADAWGYCAPGWPELAAEFAHRDAAVSHTGNGIYGEMFFAAVLAAALAQPDARRALEIGLSEIPADARLARAIRQTMEIARRHDDWETARAAVAALVSHYHMVHTINNACYVVLALLHAHGDFERAITLAVMAGGDVDCTGATAGSIMGALLGADALPDKWITPLNDRLKSIVIGFPDNRVSQLAERTYTQARRVIGGEGKTTQGTTAAPDWE